MKPNPKFIPLLKEVIDNHSKSPMNLVNFFKTKYSDGKGNFDNHSFERDSHRFKVDEEDFDYCLKMIKRYKPSDTYLIEKYEEMRNDFLDGEYTTPQTLFYVLENDLLKNKRWRGNSREEITEKIKEEKIKPLWVGYEGSLPRRLSTLTVSPVENDLKNLYHSSVMFMTRFVDFYVVDIEDEEDVMEGVK